MCATLSDCCAVGFLTVVAILLSGLWTAGAKAEGEDLTPSRKPITDDAVLGNVECLEGSKTAAPGNVSGRGAAIPSAELWSMDALREVPLDVEVVSTETANGYRVEGLYLTGGITPEGPNRIFCHYARPENPDTPVPAILILTGGTEDHRLALWAAQLLECGVVDVEWRCLTAPNRSKWAGAVDQSVWAAAPDITDNFAYHMVTGIRRVIDFLCTQPAIDPSRIACGGGSMGGFYSLLVAGVDHRVRCVADTYAAGVGTRSSMKSAFAISLTQHFSPDERKRWMDTYDPATYAPRTEASVFMFLGANDFFFWLGDAVQYYETLPGEKRLLIVPNYNHNFGSFGAPVPKDPWQEWFRSCLQGGDPFPEVTQPECNGRTYTWRARGPLAITDSALYWSPGNVPWPARYWLAIPARHEDGAWLADVPEEFAAMTAKVFVTVFDEKGRAVSSIPLSRDGRDPWTDPGPLWAGGALWDEAEGACAWRLAAVMKNPGPTKTFLEATAAGSLRVGPAADEEKFAIVTNSVVLAGGNAATYKGIRLVIDGAGRPGRLTVALQKGSGSPQVVEYVKGIDYGAESTCIDLPWEEFSAPVDAGGKPYPFDGLRLDGRRSDGSAITIERLRLYK